MQSFYLTEWRWHRMTGAKVLDRADMSTIRHILMTELWPRKVDVVFNALAAVGLITLGWICKSWSMGLTGLILLIPPGRRSR